MPFVACVVATAAPGENNGMYFVSVFRGGPMVPDMGLETKHGASTVWLRTGAMETRRKWGHERGSGKIKSTQEGVGGSMSWKWVDLTARVDVIFNLHRGDNSSECYRKGGGSVPGTQTGDIPKCLTSVQDVSVGPRVSKLHWTVEGCRSAEQPMSSAWVKHGCPTYRRTRGVHALSAKVSWSYERIVEVGYYEYGLYHLTRQLFPRRVTARRLRTHAPLRVE
ncbi:hypothetical protein HYPSUDRAFT_53034 [Hypholoma sublateritium FD-334 SS-4]|uniref:Uncharacterized protein n=1 Tax=Hypholoma sublateritium (strain FD-334 SS-4) TaxID=945553 RepID=A0A0D2PA24_HYPSF|nr:hypothetical protein HYPSUDRAFT_53034 [Hypholoma sublateritium FD-334 SS-4]